MTGNVLRKGILPEAVVPLEGDIKDRADQWNCTNPSCDYWHRPVCQNYKTQSGCKFGENVYASTESFASQPNKWHAPKKGSVALLKNSKQLGCVFQDVGRPKSKPILRKVTQFLGPKSSVHHSKGTVRTTFFFWKESIARCDSTIGTS